ncbi:MAG: hypothetical protein ACR2MO_16970 [Acidimicrobiales bacterium]
MRRTATLGAMVLMLGIGLSGCGDDDKEPAAGTGGTTTTGGTSAAVATYCEDTLAAETVPEPDIDFESLSEEEQKEATKKFVNEEFKPIVERLKKSVPAEIAAPAQVLFDATDKIGADGDFSVFESDEVVAAEEKVHAYDLANCGWEKVDSIGVEYAFQGIPATLEAGITSFEFRNDGKELHEMRVLKKADGVTESFDEILELEEEEGQQKVEQVASSFASQAETDYAVADLEAGDYLVVCFIPVGLTSEEAAPPEDSPPHFVRGMKTEFKVA